MNEELKSQESLLERILTLIESLPPMPENILEMRRICANPNASFVDLVPIIEKDPGLCADVLRVANSAYFGVSHTVESVREAVRYIGFNSVVDFISVSFSKKALNDQFSAIRNLEEYFEHSNSVSHATRCLAIAAGKKPEIQEFYAIAGLLHDVGRLVILMVSDAQVRSFSDDMASYNQELLKDEYDVFGINHCLVGKQICEKWKFSKELQTAILMHHSPTKEPRSETAAFIMLAHFIAMDDFPISQVISFYPPEMMARLNLGADRIRKARELYFDVTSK